jgi:hypothetical protein
LRDVIGSRGSARPNAQLLGALSLGFAPSFQSREVGVGQFCAATSGTRNAGCSLKFAHPPISFACSNASGLRTQSFASNDCGVGHSLIASVNVVPA